MGRRLLFSANLLLTGLCLAVLFLLLNHLSNRHYLRWDFTPQRLSALAEPTHQTLKALTDPVAVTIFYQPTHRLTELTTDLLKEYERLTPRLTVEQIDPEQDVARAKALVKTFQLEELNVVLFQSGDRRKVLTETDLAEYDYSAMQMGGQPRVTAFKGEEAFTAAIISVTQPQAPRVWFATGHGEKTLEDDSPSGLASLHTALEQQSLTIDTVTLLEHTSIPPDVSAVIIAGPTRRYTDSEVTLLEQYLTQGGKLLALLDPLDDSGLHELCERWGIVVGNDIVVDPVRKLPFVSAANLFVTDYTQHPIVEKMGTFMTLYPLARSVRPRQPVPDGLTVTPLALTSEAGWAETQTSVETFQFTEGEDLAGPVSIAVAAERPSTVEETGTAPTPARLVVIGDSDFIINAQLGNVGNRDLVLSAIYWLTAQEQRIGISPKTLESIKLHLTGGQLTGIFWFSLLGMPLAYGLLGAGIWWVRRT